MLSRWGSSLCNQYVFPLAWAASGESGQSFASPSAQNISRVVGCSSLCCQSPPQTSGLGPLKKVLILNRGNFSVGRNDPSQFNDLLTLQWSSPPTYFSHQRSRPQLVPIYQSHCTKLFKSVVIITDLQHNMIWRTDTFKFVQSGRIVTEA